MKRSAESSAECDKVKCVLMPSTVFRPLAENWCISTCDIGRVDFEWNFQHFAFVEEDKTYQSTEFKGIKGSSNVEWNLQLRIRGEEVYVYLILSNRYIYSKSHRVSSKAKIAIVNQSTANPKINLPESKVGSYQYTIPKQLANSYLLSDGSLTICCEIEERIGAPKNQSTEDVAVKWVQPTMNRIDQCATRLERLFEDMTLSDVILSVRGRQFKAHKCILASSSKVFSAMFEHPTKENITNQIVIEDIEPEVFQELLRFIYTGRLTSLETMAARLFVAADKYLLDQLKSECEIHLLGRMSADNCLELLKLVSHQINPADNLKQGAVEFFRRFPKEVMATDGWKKAKQQHPNHPVWSLILEIM